MRPPGLRNVATLALALFLVSAGSASGHAGAGDAYTNCLNRPGQSWIETYPPAGVPVLNRTARRDRQTVFYRAHLWYYRFLGNAQYGWVEAGPSEEFYARVAERRGKRRTTAYWVRAYDGDVRRWGTSWTIAYEVNAYVQIDLVWKKGGRVVHTDLYDLRSLGYTTAPNGNRYWGDTCYQWNHGLTVKFDPSAPTTIYYPKGTAPQRQTRARP